MNQRLGRRLRVDSRRDYCRQGRGLVGAGVALGAATAVVLLLVEGDALVSLRLAAAALNAVAVGFIIWGVALVLKNRKTIIDGRQGTALVGGRLLEAGDIAAVVAYSRVEHVGRTLLPLDFSSDHGSHERLRFLLGLFLADLAEDAAQDLRELRREVDEVLADGNAEDAYRTSRRRIGEVHQRLRGIVEPAVGSTMVVADSRDELSIWRTAEAVAKCLDVPVIDLCGGRPELRCPVELKLSAKERIAAGVMSVAEPKSATQGLEVERQSGDLRVSWSRSPREQLLPLLALFLLFAVCGVGLGLIVERTVGLVVVPPSVGVAMLAAAVLRKAGRYTLTLDDRNLVVTCGIGWRRREVMMIDDLELLRVSHHPRPSLNLMSDTAVIRLPMPSRDARWLRATIERRLARQVGVTD